MTNCYNGYMVNNNNNYHRKAKNQEMCLPFLNNNSNILDDFFRQISELILKVAFQKEIHLELMMVLFLLLSD